MLSSCGCLSVVSLSLVCCRAPCVVGRCAVPALYPTSRPCTLQVPTLIGSLKSQYIVLRDPFLSQIVRVAKIPICSARLIYLIASRIPPGQVSRKMQSQYGPTSAGKGHENRRPWVQKEAPQVKFRPPGGPLESSWGVLGAESASEERSGRKRGVSKKLWRALGTTLGSSWRVLGPFWVAFPPPPGGPRGGSRRSFLDVFGTSQQRS